MPRKYARVCVCVVLAGETASHPPGLFRPASPDPASLTDRKDGEERKPLAHLTLLLETPHRAG